MLVWLLLVPLAAILLLNLPYADALRRRAFTLGIAIALLQAIVVVLQPLSWWNSPSPAGRFMALNHQAGALSQVMLLSIGLAVFAAISVGRSTLGQEGKPYHFVNVVLASLIGMNGAVLVTDLFSLYVFIEIVSVTSFVLIAFSRGRLALEGAFTYIVMSIVASVLMLSGTALLMMVAGSTGFSAVHGALKASGGSTLAKIAIGAFVCGLFVKGGLVPFHGWVLGAYSAAPSAASVLLAGIATKVSGIYGLIRLTTTVFPPSAALNDVLMLVGTVSIIVGALAALTQQDIKRMLAYSSISQVGYIVLGLGCGTALGVAGAVFHLFNHCILKSLLFVNASALEQRVGTTNMQRMGGLGTPMPVTGVSSLVACLSTAGVPPFSGFWSKLIIVLALWQAQHRTYALIAILLSVLTLAYLLVLQRKVFFGKVSQELAALREAGAGLAVPELVLAAITILLGLLFPLLLDSFLVPIGGIL